MAVKRFLVDIDLSKNQLLNAVLQNLATPPSSPSEGQMYYDTTDDTAYIWDGTQWLDLAKLQNASEVPFTPTGNTLSTNVQAAIEELQTEIDTISGSSGTTNLSNTPTATQVTVESDTGNNTVIAAATNSDAGVMSAADKSKLDGIEALADVTDSTNVDAAGAVMNSDTSTAAMNFVIDEDDMVSDSNTKVPTQQSVKAYVDGQVTGSLVFMGDYNASTNTPNLESGAGVSTGDTYVVTVAGNFFTEAVQVGDMVIAKENSANTLAKWSVVNKNIPDIVDASETTKGIVELATQAEVDAGTDTTRAITPATLAGALGVTGTLTSALTYTATIGDNTSTSIAVTHNIGRPVQTQVYKVTTGEEVGCEIVNTNTNVVTLKFNIAPTTAELRVVIAG
jgi:hypothetical protein